MSHKLYNRININKGRGCLLDTYLDFELTSIVSMGGVKMLLACKYNSYANINVLHKDYNYKYILHIDKA